MIKMFELLEDLRPSGTAKAVLLKWDGEKYVRSNQKIELNEFVGTHGDRGDRGYCFYSDDSKRWEAASGLFEQVAGWLP